MRDAPADGRPYLWLTEIDRRLKGEKSDLLEPHFRTALRLDPELDKARLGLADLLRDRHRLDEAGQEYAAYVARKPKDPAGHTGLGRVALERADGKAAARHLDRALALAPDDPTALKHRALAELRFGDPAALPLLDKGIRADPLDDELLYNRSLALKRLGRAPEAEADVRRLDRLRREQAEVAAIRDRLVADPDNNEIRCEIARWMLDHGRDGEALRWARYVLDGRPNHPVANRLMADYYQRKGDPGRANYYRLTADQGR
jgi:tetratricopeptide (TPR) repeat protein